MCSKLETPTATLIVGDRIKYVKPWFAGTIHGQAGAFNADEDHNWLIGDEGVVTHICGPLIDGQRDDGVIDTFMADEIVLLPSGGSPSSLSHLVLSPATP